MTVTRAPAFFKWYAQARPMIPAPTIATCDSLNPAALMLTAVPRGIDGCGYGLDDSDAFFVPLAATAPDSSTRAHNRRGAR